MIGVSVWVHLRRNVRTTQQNLDIMTATREVLLNLVLGDESGTTSPTSRGIVEHVEDREPDGVRGSQLIQFSLEQDILWINVGVNEGDLCLVRRVLESSTDDLEHGSDPGSSSDHSKLTRQVRGIDKFTLGAFDLEFVPNFEERYMAGDVTLLIGLETVQQRIVRTRATHTLISRSKWPRSSSLLVGV